MAADKTAERVVVAEEGRQNASVSVVLSSLFFFQIHFALFRLLFSPVEADDGKKVGVKRKE